MKRQKVVTTRVWGCALHVHETPKRWRWMKPCPFGKVDMDGACESCKHYILRGESVSKYNAVSDIKDAILVEEAVVLAPPEPVNAVEPESEPTPEEPT